MFIINQGSCSMDNHDWEHIIGCAEEEGETYLNAFKDELEMSGLDINDVYEIELKGSQKMYLDAYSKLVVELIAYHKNKSK